MEPPRLAVRASAPGKVILHGEHAVMFGQTALAASLGLRTTVTIEEEKSSGEPVIRLHLPSVELEETIPVKRVAELFGATGGASWERPREVDHEGLLAAVDAFVKTFLRSAEAWSSVQRNSVRGFLYLLAGVLGSAAPRRRDMRVRVSSELALGAGSGSSAAFAVSTAAALLRLRALRGGGERAGGGGERASGFSADDEALISAWAFNCERIMHGAPSGVDNATCTFGGLVWFRQDAAPRALRPPPALRVLLVDTRVSRQTKALASRVAALRAREAAAVDCVVRACGHVADSAVQIFEQLSDCEGDTDSLYRHLAELWSMNHCLLAALGVSHRALDDVRRVAAEYGLAAKLTGAGGGGYAIVLVPPATAESVVGALGAALRAAGFSASDTQLGGAGVRLH